MSSMTWCTSALEAQQARSYMATPVTTLLLVRSLWSRGITFINRSRASSYESSLESHLSIPVILRWRGLRYFFFGRWICSNICDQIRTLKMAFRTLLFLKTHPVEGVWVDIVVTHQHSQKWQHFRLASHRKTLHKAVSVKLLAHKWFSAALPVHGVERYVAHIEDEEVRIVGKDWARQAAANFCQIAVCLVKAATNSLEIFRKDYLHT